MGRILVPRVNGWFDGLSIISSYSEKVFEKKILSYAKEIFPGYIVFPFSLPFEDDGIIKKPDLFMIHMDYEESWIIEVEKSNDNLKHAKSQIEVFANAQYNPIYLKDKIIKKAKEYNSQTIIDEDKLLNLIRNNSPKVLVILDRYDERWVKGLNNIASICYLQVYKNTNSDEAYRLYGNYPIIYDKESHCIMDDGMPNVIEIHNKSILEKYIKDTEVLISFNGYKSSWKKFIAKNKVYIKFNGTINPLSAGKDYVLVNDLKGNLYFKLS